MRADGRFSVLSIHLAPPGSGQLHSGGLSRYKAPSFNACVERASTSDDMSALDPTAYARNDGLDVLRGLFLVLMALTHLPTGFASTLTQPFGQVSAAEGFVLLSAFLAGRVYLRRGLQQGMPAMRQALWERAATVYSHHLGLLAFGLAIILPLGLLNEQGAITGLFHQFLRNPDLAGTAAFLLVYQPPLFDILPMYVLFLLFTPWLLALAQRHGWTVPLAISVALWAAAQLGLRASFHDGLMALTGMSLPLHATGAFNPFAWQLMWVVGLWLGGATLLGAAPPLRATSRTLALLAVLALTLLAWRHTGGWHPFGETRDGVALANALIGKWDLGPLRVLNVFVLTVLIAACGAVPIRHAVFGWLATLGRSSLAVFSAHLVCCLIALAVFGAEARTESRIGLDVAIILASLCAMTLTALVAQRRAADEADRVPAADFLRAG